jgi:hypothetical protein
MHLSFIAATEKVAQHPSAGVADVGATALRYIGKGSISAEQVLGFHNPAENALRDVAAVTAASHRLVTGGHHEIPTGNLKNTVGFAYGLVTEGIISTVVELDKGKFGERLPTIAVRTDEQAERFTDIMSNPSRRRRAGAALAAASTALLSPSSPIRDEVDEYHLRIQEVSARFAGSNDVQGRMGELGQARDELVERVTPLMGLYPGISTLSPEEREIFSHNLLRHNPDPSLLGRHFGQPPAPQA